MPQPPEFSFEQLNQIRKTEFPVEEHVILDDRQMKPFISMEEFERKWGINQPPKEK